jgi:nucleoside-diphosphate-sugar epimerase
VTIHVVTVFGGTGFLGRRIVQHLRKREFCIRIASMHLERSQRLFGIDPMFGSGMTREEAAPRPYVRNGTSPRENVAPVARDFISFSKCWICLGCMLIGHQAATCD